MEVSTVPREAPGGATGVLSPRLLRLASDDRLVALVRGGSTAAFEAAYSRHHRAILSFCGHMLGSVDEAEDAVQHTFLAAYRDLITSRKEIHLRPWLFAIARNRCYSVLRARRETPVERLEEPITEWLATQVQRRQDLRDLIADLGRLPDEQREALVLAELGALSHQQIATMLGVPRERVKGLVFQARESLLGLRAARDTDCYEIREQLSTLRGGALRRANLRRHLRECPGCRQFRRQLERQRRRLEAVLPVVPALALKDGILTATVGAGASGGGLFAGGPAWQGAGLGAKGLIAALLAGVGTAGTMLAVGDTPATHRSAHVLSAARSGVEMRQASSRAAAGSVAADHGPPGTNGSVALMHEIKIVSRVASRSVTGEVPVLHVATDPALTPDAGNAPSTPRALSGSAGAAPPPASSGPASGILAGRARSALTVSVDLRLPGIRVSAQSDPLAASASVASRTAVASLGSSQAVLHTAVH